MTTTVTLTLRKALRFVSRNQTLRRPSSISLHKIASHGISLVRESKIRFCTALSALLICTKEIPLPWFLQHRRCCCSICSTNAAVSNSRTSQYFLLPAQNDLLNYTYSHTYSCAVEDYLLHSICKRFRFNLWVWMTARCRCSSRYVDYVASSNDVTSITVS